MVTRDAVNVVDINDVHSVTLARVLKFEASMRKKKSQVK